MGSGTGGADFLQLSPSAAPARGLTSWLADAVRAAIIDGRLQAGALMPATRVLADELGVSRGVIVEAYQRLADEGLVSARHGAGTRVLGVAERLPGAGRAVPGVGDAGCGAGVRDGGSGDGIRTAGSGGGIRTAGSGAASAALAGAGGD